MPVGHLLRSRWTSMFGATGIQIGLGVVTSVMLARFLGPEGRGIVFAVIFWPTFLAAVFNVSVNEAIAYHVARAHISDEAYATDLARAGLGLQIMIAVLAAITALAIMPLLFAGESRPYLSMALLYTAIFTPLAILDQHYKAVFQGRQQYSRLNAARIVQPIAYLIGLSTMIAINSFTEPNVLVAMLASIATSVLLCIAFDRIVAPRWDGAINGILLKTGIWFHGANLFLYAAAEADKMIVLGLMNDRSAGLYAVAVSVSLFGSGLVVQTMALRLFPTMSSATTAERQADVLSRNVRDAMFLLVLVNGAMIMLSPIVIPFLFGHAFSAAVPITALLLLTGVLKGVRQVMDRALRGTLNMRLGIIAEVSGLICFLLFATFLVKNLGLIGIALATVIAQATALVILAVAAAQKFSIPLTSFWGLRAKTASRLMQVALGEFQRRPRS